MGHTLINYAIGPPFSSLWFQANFRLYLLFMGSYVKVANVLLSPRREERCLVGVLGKVMKKIMFSKDRH